MESYGIFHTVVFIESNRTQTFSKRQLKYYYYNNSDNNDNDSNPSGNSYEDIETTIKMNFKLLQSKNLWGPTTDVIIEQYINENSTFQDREHNQRNEIVKQWKKQGMTSEDIGYLSDVDEFFTRDFIRAMQICHVPQFNVFETETETNVEIIESSNESTNESSSENNSETNKKKVKKNCRKKKVFSTSNIQLEGSPLCIPKSRIGRHIHPDMVIGHCIDGIGNNNNGNDDSNNGNDDSNKDLSLWTASKFRKRYDSDPNGIRYGTYQNPVGFHYHNTFTSTAVLRNKYLTYGHPQRHALHQPLRTIDNDLKFMIHCVLSTDLERKNKNKNKNKSKTMTKQQQQQQQTTQTTKTYLEDGIYNEMFQAAKSNDNKNKNNDRSSSLSSVSVSKIPIAFITVPLYVKKRHEELTTIIKQDIKDHPYANKKKKKVESTVER